MTITTDPAREFTDLCLRVRGSSTETGNEILARHFQVEAWSTDFILILASLHQRISMLNLMIDNTELDDDIKAEAAACLVGIRQAFSPNGLSNQWGHAFNHYLTDANIRTIRMASAYIRPTHGYTVPEGDELLELVSSIEDLITWLEDIDLTEKDFVRLALIEGLKAFHFRITRVGWFGWPDTIDSLKAVVAAYLALERGMPDANVSPPYDAVMKRAGELLKVVFEKVKFVKDVQETGDWLLRGYGALHLAGTVPTIVAGLLTHST